MIRNNFTKCYNKVKTLIPNITQLPVNVFTNELMNSSDYFVNIQFMKCISALSSLRQILFKRQIALVQLLSLYLSTR